MKRSWLRLYPAACLVLLLLPLGPAAQNLESTEVRLLGERPNPDGPPTEVAVSLYVFDVDGVEDVDQRFRVDLLGTLAWVDPRLALTGEERVGQHRSLPLESIWTPRLLVVNDRGLRAQLPRVVEVDDDGHIRYTQRLSGELSTDLDFREFPLDTQLLPIEVISYQYTPDEVVFAADAQLLGESEGFSAEGWSFRLLQPRFDVLQTQNDLNDRPRVTFTIEAERVVRYYVYTMFLPITLIAFMAWTVFWLQPTVIPPRIAISTASIFSLIAYGFSVRLTLPPVSYLTRADQFIIGSMVLVVFALAVVVIGSRWAGADQLDRALRLNRLARWSFSFVFVLIVLRAVFL